MKANFLSTSSRAGESLSRNVGGTYSLFCASLFDLKKKQSLRPCYESEHPGVFELQMQFARNRREVQGIERPA